MSQDLCHCGNGSLVVYLLVILFAVSSWVDINGLWVELPILVQNLPEGWDLPSYMAIIIQVANVAPLVYTIASAIYPHRILEVPVTYLIISLGAISCLLLAFLWNVTSTVAGQPHSTALFVLQFCLALVDCTSSVAFLPFMSRFKPQYMPAYFIGEGLSGLIPSLVAMGQGAGSMKCVQVPLSQNLTNDSIQVNQLMLHSNFTLNSSTQAPTFVVFPVYQDPKFTVRTFFLFLMSLMLCSLIAFFLLNNWSYCKREYVDASQYEKDNKNNNELAEVVKEDDTMFEFTSRGDDVILKPKISSPGHNGCLISNLVTNKTKKCQQQKITRLKFTIFIVLTIWLNALSNGVLPSIQTYACLPYGIQAYHLSINMASIANPVACVALIFLKMKSLAGTALTSTIGTILAAYVIYTAASSPFPPLVGHFSGSLTSILSWSITVFLLTYSKVAIATTLRSKGKKALLWVGAASQAGSLAGALVTFLLVNVFKLFTVANPCI